MKKHIFLLALIVLASPLSGLAQGVSIQGKLDRPEIKTGEQASIDLTIRTNDLAHTKFYLKEDSRRDTPYTVIAFGATDTVKVGGNIQEINAKLIITSFDSTLITIPPIVAVTPTDSAETEPLGLKVIQPEVDSRHPSNFKDIKAPWEISLSLKDWAVLIFTSWIFWLVIGLLLAFYIAYRLVSYYRKETQSSDQEITIPEKSLWERIDAKLDVLASQDLANKGLFKEFYSELIFILKEYLNEAYSWSTEEMTSDELLIQIKDCQLSSSEEEVLGGIFREADLSKFAKHTPLIEDAQDALLRIRQLIQTLEARRVSSSTDIVSQ